MDPIEVIAPDGTIITFPAGTSDEEILSVMAENYGSPEQPAAGADAYPQASSSILNPGANVSSEWLEQQGVDVERFVNDIPYAQEQLTRLGYQNNGGAWERRQEGSGPNPVSDVARSFPTGVAQGIAGLVGLPRMIGDIGTDLFDKVFPNNPGARLEREDPAAAARIDSARSFLQPSSEQVNESIQGVVGDYYQPQTTAGEYSRTVGEFLPNAIVPGGAVRKTASVVVPAALSEGLGQVGEGIDQKANQSLEDGQAPSNVEPLLRFGGGLVGGLATGIRTGGGAENVIRNATRNVSQQDLDLASALRADSPIPLTNAESLQGATGGATGMGRLQRVAEGATDRFAPMMAQRPAQTERALADVLDQIAPQTVASDVARRGQGAADEVLTTIRRRINESAQPQYDALPGQTLPEEDLATLLANPSYAGAQRSLEGNPELAALLQGGPEDISTVNRVIQQLDDLERNARPGEMNPGGNNTLASQRAQAAALARELASNASPDFAGARQTVATGREAFLEPLQSGPIGQIARQNEVIPNLRTQTNALFPAQPFEGQADETVQALRLMGEIDPSVPASLVRQHLASNASEAFQQNLGGPNQAGGAKFAAQTFGNPMQEDTILRAIDTVAPTAAPDARRLLSGLRASGFREGAGSQTSFNNLLAQELAGGNMGQNAVRAAANPAGIFGQIGRALDDRTARRNADRLAEILLGDSDTFNRVVRSQNQPMGIRARLATALAASREDN